MDSTWLDRKIDETEQRLGTLEIERIGLQATLAAFREVRAHYQDPVAREPVLLEMRAPIHDVQRPLYRAATATQREAAPEAPPSAIDERWRVAERLLQNQGLVKSTEIYDAIAREVGPLTKDQFLAMYKKNKRYLREGMPKGFWQLLPPGETRPTAADTETDVQEDAV